MTVKNVASWMQVKPRTVYQWVHEGYIPAIKLGALVRFEKPTLAAWLGKRESAGRRRRALEVDPA